jgi:hypothetical protein
MSNANGTYGIGGYPEHGQPRLNRNSFDGDDGPAHKRQRTALACNSCRYRKSRCDGAHPVCSTCRSQGLECIYRGPVPTTLKQSVDPQSLDRRLQKFEDNIQTIEGRFTRLEDLILSINNKQPANDSLHAAARPTVPSHGNTANKGTSNQPDPTLPASDTIEVLPDQCRLQTNGSMSRLWPVTMQEDTVDGMGSIIFSDESDSGFFGPSSNSAFVSKVARALASATGPMRAGRDFSRDLGGKLSRPTTPPGHNRGNHNPTNPYILPSRAESLRLIEIFFSYTGRFFPYISRSMLTQVVGELDSTRLSGVRKSTLCLLNAVFAMGTSLDGTRGRQAKLRDHESDVYFQRALILSPWTISNTANLETCKYWSPTIA